MKRKSSTTSIVMRRIICIALVFILLCSVSCKKDGDIEFSKHAQTDSSEKASKSWKKVVFTSSEQVSGSTPETSQSENETSEISTEDTTPSTGQTTNESTAETTNESTSESTSETTSQTASATPTSRSTTTTTAGTTRTTPTTAPTTAATTGSQRGLTPDQIAGNWEAYLTVDFYSEISEPGVLDSIWSEEFVFAMTLNHVSGNMYTVSLTPVKYIIEYEEASMEGIRQGPLKYEAELNNDILSFSVESEAFAFEGFRG